MPLACAVGNSLACAVGNSLACAVGRSPSSPSPVRPVDASEQTIFLREPRHTLILKRSELSMSHRRLLVAFSKDDGLCWMMSIVRLKTKMMFLVG